MEYFVIGITAFVASGLTLFSGFGLATILMPAFAIFFPVDLAIALTALVHLFNNFFKLILLGKAADRKIVLIFGLPAIVAAFAGSKFLFWLQGLHPTAQYELWGRHFQITPVKSVVAFMLIIFVLLEILPAFKNMTIDRKYLPVGGVLSGFFGGLSGQQGALRSAFLMKSGLSKEGFIATGAVLACLIDLSRLSVYGTHFSKNQLPQNLLLLWAAILCAFAGAFLGNRLAKKITLKGLQKIVSMMLFAVAFLLGAGII